MEAEKEREREGHREKRNMKGKGKNGGATLKAQKDLEKAIKDGGVFSGYNI